MIRDMRQQQIAAETPDETDENTIVLTLPRKAAEVVTDKPTTVTTTKPAVTTSSSTGPGRQYRRPAGTFGNKTATAWPTLTVGVLAGLAGTAAGAHIVNRVYQRHRERQLEMDLEGARQEYLDALGGSKQADALDQLLGLDGLEKEGVNITNVLNVPLAASAIMTILGAGGAGYITKRILDEKFRESKDRGLDMPRVERIIFRSEPKPQLAEGVPISSDEQEEEEEKEASAEDITMIKAAVCVMMDSLDTEPRILNTPYVKDACAKAGLDKESLLKSAQDINTLLEYLRGNNELQTLLTRASMEQHPALKHFRWATKLPFIGDMANKRTMSKIEGAFAPKVAGAFPLLTSILGSSIAESAGRDDTAERVVAIQQAQARKAKPEDEAKKIDVSAEDPGAQEYVDENRARIVALLEQLVRQGKL